MQTGTFLSGPEVKNLPCNAGDVGLILGGGTKIPHATGQLNPRTPSTESASHKESQCSAAKDPTGHY